MPHDVRDQVVDFVRRWSEKTEISAGRFIAWLGVTVSKFYNWRQRYGRVNEHNGWVPRDFWLERKRLTNTPVRQAGSVLKCSDDRKNRVVSAQATYASGGSAVGG